ncbi:hypothetical protein [Bradyrhizobium japonicum]|uniref:hypothetical protein n=1 Tax=Bradyrhizobium japonicum TaxID=375 RepID=UPI001BA48332|nr:hypothetical protein [Bradyrhizobium japonicum]MBR0913130.1 hypothetical protein [Bradyrhizobium japonicum]
MATLDELGTALVNADKAGDVNAARALAGEITRMRQLAPPAAPAAPAAVEAAPSYDAMGMPTGAEAAAPVQAGMSYGDQMSRVGSALDKGVRLAANGATFGLADKFAGGMDALTGRAPTYDAGVRAQRAETQAVRDANPVAAGAAEAAGGLLTGTGLVKSGVTLAGRGVGMLPRVLGYGVEGGAYGAVHGAGNTYSDRIKDYIEAAKNGGTTGALIGGGLPLVGNAAGGLYRTGAAFLGPRVEGASRGASAMLRAAAQADEAGLRALPGMGPEAMLVDAGPAMLGLGQGAGTGTGAGRTALVDALKTRDNGTGHRLATALDTNLGPAPIPSRIEAGLSGDRAYAGLDYQPLLQNARPTNTRALADQLDDIAIVERGGAQRAAAQVRDMLDGQPLRNAAPGARPPLSDDPAVLLNTREAIDGMLTTEADPNTIRVLTQTRQAVDEELARSVPGIKAVDAQLAESHRQSAALQRGTQVLDGGKTAIRPVELADEVTQGALPQGEMIGPSAAPVRLRQGARAEVDRLVGTNVNDLNALEKKIGTPQDWNSQKLETIFGEEPVANVAKALMDNRRFRQSYQDIVQNSQTAQRVEAAAAMRGSEGGNVPHDVTLTGIGLKALNMVAKAISGASNARTKDEIGNILASQGPAAQRVARALLESARQTGENSRAINRVLSSPYWISATGPGAGRRSTQ